MNPTVIVTKDNTVNEIMEELVSNGATYVEDGEQEQPRNISIKNPGEAASPKQLGMLRAVLRNQGISDNKEVADVCSAAVNRNITKLDELTKGEASALITQYK
jgi:hypothetical protein